MMDINKCDQSARPFVQEFLSDRNINREFYERVPEEHFDFRMVDQQNRKSDSPRESLAHQIRVQHDYVQAVETGKLEFSRLLDLEDRLKTESKATLLRELEAVDHRLVDLLCHSGNCKRLVEVPWNKERVDVITMLRSLHQHEILHTGWNLAIMDHLGIERFPALRQAWG
jgi:uncharacterized damage-inducible protein DinB